MNGLVFCHGRAHNEQGIMIPEYFRAMDITWTYVDVDPKTRPDYIGSMHDQKFLSTLGDSKYDIILLFKCPLGGKNFFPISLKLLTYLYPLLKPDGQLVYYNFLFFVMGHYANSMANIEGKMMERGDYTYHLVLNDMILQGDRRGLEYIYAIANILQKNGGYSAYGILPQFNDFGPYTFEQAAHYDLMDPKRDIYSTMVFVK